MRHLFAFILPLLLVGCIQEAKWTWTGDTPGGDVAMDGVTGDGKGDVVAADVPGGVDTDAAIPKDTTDTLEPLDTVDALDAVDVCVPDCNGKDCGDDGCGGSCGECDDGDPCNGEEACEEGLCVEGTSPSCDDENPCTDDACVEGEGCENTAVADQGEPACDDGNPCTDDACVSGACANPIKPLEELVVEDCLCEDDEDCEPLEDDDLCNGTLVCDQEAEPSTCMVDEETVVTCTLPEDLAPECNASICTPGSGECAVGAINEGGDCDDGDACTQGEQCHDGICKNGGPVSCEDSNGCTDDSCDPVTGCVNTPNTDSCDDDNDCTHTDVCSGGTCAGTPYSCDDPSQCETAVGAICDGEGSCTYETAPLDGTPCNDGDACTEGEACTGGACLGGGAVDCNDDNICTDDGCDPLSGCTYSNNDAGCSDDDTCTTGDHCGGGDCITTGILDCDDGNECTADTCIAGVGCNHVPGNESEPCYGDLGVCFAGTCCIPVCDGKVCGDNGCGGSCGQCDADIEECVEPTTGGSVCAAKMVVVPAGNFWMGCNNCAGSTVNDTDCGSDEHPYHEVYLDTYEMDRTEVTAAQYLACVTAGGCDAPAGTGPCKTYETAGKENHPINHVNWGQIEAYCLWAGKELCTEAQWEKGARGGCEHNSGTSSCKAQSRKYPWGNAAPTCDLAVKSGCDGDTQAVCSKSPAGDSPYGLCDMAGNVLEWVADWYGSDYYCASSGADTSYPFTYCTECGSWPDSPNPWNNPYYSISDSSWRVLRGGNFTNVFGPLRVSYRNASIPLDSGDPNGGRCCRPE